MTEIIKQCGEAVAGSVESKKFKAGVFMTIVLYLTLLAPMFSERITVEIVKEAMFYQMAISLGFFGAQGAHDWVKARNGHGK